MIFILYTTLSKDCFDKYFHQLLNILPLEFKSKIIRYTRWQDAQASLFGRLLLKHGLKKYFNFDLDFGSILYNEYSKPYITDNFNLYFNISHSGNLVCCAISSNSKVGIDIEEINNNINIVDFNNQMTETEMSKIIESENYLRTFYGYWTQKEAIIKLEGKGLTIPLNSFEVKKHRTYIFGNQVHLKEININDLYVCYLASYDTIESKKIKVLNTELCVDF